MDWRSLNTEAQIIGHYALESTKLPERLVRECNDDRMTQVWVPSSYVKSIAVSNGIIENKLHIVSHGFDPLIFRPIESPVINKKWTFLYVGGYTGKNDRKGADLIAEASRRLYNTTQDFVVIFKINTIYGGQENLKDLEAPHHSIITTNYTDEEMGGLYNLGDCFITASSGEAFNMTLLEAMACGLPCISPRNTGEADFYRDSPYILQEFTEVPAKYSPWDNGLWFKPDVDEIVERMRTVLNDNPIRRSYNLTGYTWDEVALKIMEVLGCWDASLKE